MFTPSPLQIGNKFVQWGLAVSRSFGDLPLKDPKVFGGPSHCTELVSTVPEITHFTIDTKTDCAIILACDGIWDVLKDDDAAIIAHAHAKCGVERLTKLDSKIPTAQTQPLGGVVPCIKNAAMQAARGVNRESFQKYSMDNLTTVVVRMKPMHPSDIGKQEAAMAAQVKQEPGTLKRMGSGSVKQEGGELFGAKEEPDSKRAKREQT